MPSHYLKQCWLIVNWTPGSKLQWNLKYKPFNSWKWTSNFHMRNGGHFVQDAMSLETPRGTRVPQRYKFGPIPLQNLYLLQHLTTKCITLPSPTQSLTTQLNNLNTSYIICVLTLIVSIFHEAGPVQNLLNRHCGCWWPGAVAPGHLHPQYPPHNPYCEIRETYIQNAD